MDGALMFFGMLVVVVVLAVPVLLVMALVSVASLKRRVAALEDALARGQVGEAGRAADPGNARHGLPQARELPPAPVEPAPAPVPPQQPVP